MNLEREPTPPAGAGRPARPRPGARPARAGLSVVAGAAADRGPRRGRTTAGGRIAHADERWPPRGARPSDPPGLRLGAALVRHRQWIPVPLAALAIAAPSRASVPMMGTGALLLALGAALTLAAGAVHREGVRGIRQLQPLATTGIFAWTRNPRALAAALAWPGLGLLASASWLVALALIAWGAAHAPIVRHEEAMLEAAYGDEWARYRRRVPRWVPRRPAIALAARADWPAAWQRERGTLLGWLALAAACALTSVAA